MIRINYNYFYLPIRDPLKSSLSLFTSLYARKRALWVTNGSNVGNWLIRPLLEPPPFQFENVRAIVELK